MPARSMNWKFKVWAMAVAISRPPLPVRREIVTIAICYIQTFMHYLGVDIGGTSIKAGLIDETGRVLESCRALTITHDLNGFLSTLAELVREFQKIAAIDAIGIGVPGLHSSKTHIIGTSPNIPCLKQVNLAERLSEQVHIRTISENDANAAAYAEFIWGAGC